MRTDKLFLEMNNSPYYPQAHQSNPQQYHQQQKHVSMPATFLTPNRQRKIIANVCGMVVAVMIIVILFACMAYGIFNAIKVGNDPVLISADFAEISSNPYIIALSGYRPYVFIQGHYEMWLVTLVSYLLMCLIFMYVPIRSLCQKSFTAGQPSKVQMWPLSIAIVLRIAIEIIFITKSSVSDYPVTLALSVNLSTFSFCFATYVFSIYTADDDNLEPGQVNMKPWVFEKEDILRLSIELN